MYNNNEKGKKKVFGDFKLKIRDDTDVRGVKYI